MAGEGGTAVGLAVKMGGPGTGAGGTVTFRPAFTQKLDCRLKCYAANL
jgi:hypothetical protein